MPLTLTLATNSTLPIDAEAVAPDRLAGKSPAEIERIPIGHGTRRLPLAELFRVSGDASDGRLVLEGNLGAIHRLGAGMTGGEILVKGDIGRHLGAGMTGGTIRVDGNAGDWAGAEMKGGLIRIGGSAGDHLGAAYAGSKRGMTDGTILVTGSAGEGVGRSMRRGLLAIGGSCGDSAGTGMIAGTLFVFGASGAYPGAEMRRGTIALLGSGTPRLLPTFRRTGEFRPLFLGLIGRELRRLDFPAAADVPVCELTLYRGDLLSLGKGEIWLRDGGATR